MVKPSCCEEVADVEEQTILSDGQTLYDPQQWYDKSKAAEFMGCTTRTLERWIDTKLHPLTLRQKAKHPLTVFSRAELEALKKERKSQTTPAHREPSPTLPTARQTDMAVSNGHAVSSRNSHLSTLPTTTTPVMSGASGLVLASILFEKGTYLTMKEAQDLTRWPEKALKQAVEEKRVQRAPGRTWLLRTVDLL
jgi:hypothetical protein